MVPYSYLRLGRCHIAYSRYLPGRQKPPGSAAELNVPLSREAVPPIGDVPRKGRWPNGWESR